MVAESILLWLGQRESCCFGQGLASSMPSPSGHATAAAASLMPSPCPPPCLSLAALGAANLVGACFSCYNATGSFSRSAVNNDVGAKTPLAGGVCGELLPPARWHAGRAGRGRVVRQACRRAGWGQPCRQAGGRGGSHAARQADPEKLIAGLVNWPRAVLQACCWR